MPLMKICLRGAHHTIFPLHHLFIYLAATRPWSVARARARARTQMPHSFSSQRWCPRNSRHGRNFFPPPAGSDRGQRSSIHRGRARARAQTVARTPSAPKIHIPAPFVCSDVWSVQVVDGGQPRLLQILLFGMNRPRRARLCASMRPSQSVRQRQGEHVRHRFSFHPLGTYNVMGTKKFITSASTWTCPLRRRRAINHELRKPTHRGALVSFRSAKAHANISLYLMEQNESGLV